VACLGGAFLFAISGSFYLPESDSFIISAILQIFGFEQKFEQYQKNNEILNGSPVLNTSFVCSLKCTH
jgi:hypothetical protein